MTAIRVAKRKRYVSVDREAVNDSRLSFRARGILVWLLDKPDDWKTSSDRIADQGKEGREAVRTALAELEEFGYLVLRKWRSETTGRWQSEWVLYEVPSLETRSGDIAQDALIAAEPAPGSRGGFPETVSWALLEKTEEKTETERASRARPRDPVFDAIVEALDLSYSDLSQDERKRVGQVRRALPESATAQQVHDRCGAWAARYGRDRLTMNVIRAKWGEMGKLVELVESASDPLEEEMRRNMEAGYVR